MFHNKLSRNCNEEPKTKHLNKPKIHNIQEKQKEWRKTVLFQDDNVDANSEY